jgi:hypothetical protein
MFNIAPLLGGSESATSGRRDMSPPSIAFGLSGSIGCTAFSRRRSWYSTKSSCGMITQGTEFGMLTLPLRCSRWQRGPTPDVGKPHRMEHTLPQSRTHRSAPRTGTLARCAAALALVFETFAARISGCGRMRREAYVDPSAQGSRSSPDAHLEGTRDWYRRAVPVSLLK